MNKQDLNIQCRILALEQEQKEALFQASLNEYKIAGIFILALLLTALYFLYQLRKKNQAIEDQNIIISDALAEKDVLLREIHHRVKNNLQVVSSLLSLQSRQIEDEGIRQAISEGRNRVRSMALIHQNLYQKEKLTGISVKDYLVKLTTELFDTYNVSKERIDLELNIEEIDLDVDTMVPLGLIINELVSNALKHAFPEQRSGKIIVSLSEHNESLILKVKDNGVGLPKEEVFNDQSFGNRLITAFSKKLRADLKINGDDGMEVSMKINNYLKAA